MNIQRLSGGVMCDLFDCSSLAVTTPQVHSQQDVTRTFLSPTLYPQSMTGPRPRVASLRNQEEREETRALYCPHQPSGGHHTHLQHTTLLLSHWSGIIEAFLSLVQSFIMMKYFHSVARPPPLSLPYAGSSWHRGAYFYPYEEQEMTRWIFGCLSWFFMA